MWCVAFVYKLKEMTIYIMLTSFTFRKLLYMYRGVENDVQSGCNFLCISSSCTREGTQIWYLFGCHDVYIFSQKNEVTIINVQIKDATI